MLQPIFKTQSDQNFFFGYYDKSPLDKSNRLLLAHRTKFIDRAPQTGDKIEVGYFDWQANNHFKVINSSASGNWQQGSMLQWMPPQYTDAVIYNVLHDDKFQCEITEISGKILQRIPSPIYCLHPSGKYALTIDYERYYWIRPGYHYKGLEIASKNTAAPAEDGIWRVNLDSGQLEKIVELGKIINFSQSMNQKQAVHWLEHLMFCPDGTRFIFYHRVRTKENQVLSRLFSVDSNGDNLRLLLDSGRLTHASWRNNHQIICYAGRPSIISSVLKNSALFRRVRPLLVPLYKVLTFGANSSTGTTTLSRLATGDCYMLLDDTGGKTKILDCAELNKDGHPSFSSAHQNLMLSDTYPDPNQNFAQQLFVFDLESNTKTILAEHQHPAKHFDTAQRCDLHPRWSFDGNFIIIDVLNELSRGLEIYRFNSN